MEVQCGSGDQEPVSFGPGLSREKDDRPRRLIESITTTEEREERVQESRTLCIAGLFQCMDCDELPVYRMWARVFLKEGQQRLFKCNVCQKKYLDGKSEFERKVLKSEWKKYPVPLAISGLVVWSLKMEVSQKGCNKKRRLNDEKHPFKCEICDRGFEHGRSMSRHRLEVHVKSLQPRKCEICGSAFGTGRGLAEHLNRNNCIGRRPRQPTVWRACTYCPKWKGSDKLCNFVRHENSAKHRQNKSGQLAALIIAR